ncbi:hypothetical protein B8A41_04480 [Dolosigranulum pigrum]|uniref:GA module-containing protein n=1 Tax=Dolosigranulum pigrum TaxID=29394 RepID=UPI00155E655D|nr:GA module-containing protein [Dolosigranulum pigrum]QJS97889.1 hypothetical protein B8A41_04480 [Dolosigranulum pigrum]
MREEINKLTGKTEITQGEYTNLINLYNEFKGAIEEGRRAIADIPPSNEIYPLGGSYNTQRNIHETQLPQNDVVLPVAPPREKVNIGNPTQLTNTEKTSVKNKLKETNPGLDLSIVTVRNDGTVSVRWDETNTTIINKDKIIERSINKDKIIERSINKDRLQEALTIAEKTVNDDYYKNSLDETLKREHFAAKVEGEWLLTDDDALQQDITEAADKLYKLETQIATKKFLKAIDDYKTKHNALPRMSNGNPFVTEKAHNELTDLLAKINEFSTDAWSKVQKTSDLDKRALQGPILLGNAEKTHKLPKSHPIPEVTLIKTPTEKILVNNLSSLDNNEQIRVENALRNANDFPAGTKITVSNDGTATIVFPDNTMNEPSQKVINGNMLVRGLSPEEILEKAKQSAKTELQGLTNLTADEQQELGKLIEDATREEEVEGHLAVAKGKDTAKATINGLSNLSNEEKDVLVDEITNTNDLDEVAQVVEEAKGLNTEKGEEAEDLDGAKQSAKTELQGLTNLTADEQQELGKLIEDATREEEVEGHLAVAKGKDTAKATINGLSNLSNEEKDVLVDEITNTNDLDEVAQVVEEAKGLNTEKGEEAEDLDGAKQSAKTELQGLTNLTADEQQELGKLIEDATREEEVEGHLAVAKGKDTAKATINGLSNLSNEEKDVLVDEITNTNDLDEVAQVVEEAKGLNTEKGEEAEDLDGAKQSAKTELQGLTNLTADEQQELGKLIEDATREEEVEGHLAVAKGKDTAKATINGLSNLSNEEKDVLVDEITNTNDLDEVAQVVEEAKGLNTEKGEEAEDLDGAKQSAKTELQGLTNLTADEQQELGKLIEDATREEEVEGHLAVAKGKDTAKATINGLSNLSNEEKDVLVDEITNTNDLDEVAQVVEEAKGLNTEKGEEAEDLDGAKQSAKTELQGLTNLTADEQQELGKLIEDATREEEVEGHLAVAKGKDTAKATINGLSNLSNEEKDVLVDEITNTNDLDEVAQVVEEAKGLNTEKGEEAEDLDGAKQSAKTELQGLTNLTADEQQELGKLIEDATREEEVEGHLAVAKGKDTAKATINGLSNLSNEEKDVLVDEITNTNDLDEVAQVVEEAKGLNTEKGEEAEDLDGAKQSAKTELQGLTNLTADEQQELGKLIEDATREEEVEGHLAVAKGKDTAKATINGLSNLSNEEKDVLVDEITNTNDLDEVAQVVEEAKGLNTEKGEEAEDLDGAKQSAKTELQGLTNLTADEQQELGKLIEDATREEEVEGHLAVAKGKDTAKATINGLSNLSNEEKDVLVDEITNTNDLDEVAQVVEEAKGLNTEKGEEAEDLDGAKQSAKTELQGLTNLTADEQQELGKLIEDATREEEVEGHLAVAKGKDTAKATINGLSNLSNEEKDVLVDEITNTNDLDEVAQVVEEAKGLNTDRRQQLLERKEQLIDKVVSVVTDEEDRASFLQAIDEAEDQEDLDNIEEQIGESQEADGDELFGPALAAAKEGALADIAGLDHHTEEEKANLAALVNSADSLADLDQIDEDIAKAIEENDRRQQLLERKEQLIDKVVSVVTDEEDRASFLQAIDEAEDQEDLDNIEEQIGESQEADGDELFGPALAAAKEGALADIAGLDHHTEEEKANLAALVNSADSLADLDQIDEDIAKAIEENDRRQQLLERKEQLIDKVVSVVTDEEDRASFLQAIDEAEDQEDLDNIEEQIGESQEADGDELFGPALAAAKEGALADIAGLDHHTEEEKANLAALVNSADSLADLDQIDEDIAKAIEENDRRQQLLERKEQLIDKVVSVVTDEEDRASFLQAIDEAEDQEDLDNIEEQIGESQEADGDELFGPALAAAKEGALADIAGLDHHTEEEKANLATLVNSADSLADLDQIDEDIAKAIEENDRRQQLLERKEQLIDKVVSVVTDEEDRASFLQAIDEAEDQEDLDNIEEQIGESQEADGDELFGPALAAAKEGALADIAGLDHHTEEEKANLAALVNSADSLADLDQIDEDIAKAIEENDRRQQLLERKEQLIDKVVSVVTDEEDRASFLQAIDEAEDQEDLDNIEEQIGESQEADGDELFGPALAAAKEGALADIAGLDHHTEEEKANLAALVNSADSLADLDQIDEDIAKAIEENDRRQQLLERKEQLIDKVVSVVTDEEDRASFLQAIDEAEDQEDLDNIEEQIGESQEADGDELFGPALAAAKEGALADIAGLDHHTEEEKANLAALVNSADSLADLDQIDEDIAKAIEENDRRQQLLERKEQLIDKVVSVVTDEEDRASFLQAIDEAEDQEDLDNIEEQIGESQEADGDELFGPALAAAKEGALADIAGLDHHTEEEKANLAALVNSADSLADLDQIDEDIAKAIEENDRRQQLLERKEQLIDKVVSVVTDEEDRASFLQAIDEAEDQEDLDNIEEQIGESQEADGDELFGPALAAAKEGALADIAGLDHHTEEEKANLAALVNSADSLADLDQIDEDIAKAIEENDRRQQLLERKEQLIDKVVSVVTDEEDRASFLQAIDEAEDQEDLDNIEEQIGESQEADGDELFGPALAAAKEGALADIAGLDHHTEEEKANLAALVNSADSLADLDQIDEDIAKAIEENDRRQQLLERKEQLIDKVVSVVTDEEDRASFLQAIDEAEDQEDLDNIEEQIGESQEADGDELFGPALAAAKEGALADIAGLDHHTEEEKANLAALVNSADSLADLDQIDEDIAKAIEENDRRQQLLERKEQLIDKVVSVVTDEEDRASFLQAIDEAEDQEDLDNIEEQIGESQEADGDELFGPALAAAKEGALADIAGLDHHTEEEKANLAALVNSADSLADLDQIDEDIAKAIEENDRRHKLHEVLVEAELGANSNNSLGEAKELTREDLVGSGEFSNPDGFEEENLGDYYVGSEDEADATAEDFTEEFDKNEAHGKLVEAEVGRTPNDSLGEAKELTREDLVGSGEFSNPDGFEEENLGDYYVGSEDEADATAEDFTEEFDKNEAHGKLVEAEVGRTPNDSLGEAKELTREDLVGSGEFSNPDGFEEENLGDYYVGSEDEADATAEDFTEEFDKNEAHGKLVEAEVGRTPNDSLGEAKELTREDLVGSGEFSNPDGFEEENLGDYYVGSEDEADATAEDFTEEFDKNEAHGKLVEAEVGRTPNDSLGEAKELTREDLVGSGEFSNPDGFEEENLGDYYVGSEDEADATAEDFTEEFDKNEAHGKLVEAEVGRTPNDSLGEAKELTREDLVGSGEFSNPDGFEEENLGDYYVGSEDEADATAEDFTEEFDKNEAHGKLVEAEVGRTPNDSLGEAKELTREDLVGSGEFSNPDGFEEENLGDYYVGSEDEADATAEDFTEEFDKNEAHGKLVEAEVGRTPNDSLGEAKELTREDLVGSGEFSNPDGFEEENLGDYYVGSEDEADATAEDFAGEFDKNDAQGKLVESELGATPNNSASSATAESELTREELSKSGEFSNPIDVPNNSRAHALALINEKPEFPAEELARLLQVERDKAAAYIVSLPNLDTSKVNEFKAAIQNAQTVPVIEEIIQTAEALNAKLVQTTPESGNGASTIQPEKPEFEGGTHGLGLINEKPEFPAEELAQLLQVERDKAAAYIANLPNLDTSKVNEFKVMIQNAQTVPVIEEIIQATEALNTELGRGKVGNEQGKPAESKGPAQSDQVELEKERPTDKPAVTDHLKNLKTEVNAQQTIQESTKQEKSGERLPDTATISWLLGVTGISTLFAGLGTKKKREDDDK